MDGVDMAYEGDRHPSTLNEVGAMNLAEVWRAVNLLSKDVAKIPLDVYRREDERAEVDRRHPGHRLVTRKINPFIASNTFIQTLTSHALLRGNGYALMTRDQRGAVNELYILNPTRMVPFIENFNAYHTELGPGQRFWYWYTWSNGAQNVYPAADVFHLKGLAYDGLEGWSVLNQAASCFWLTQSSRDFGTDFFRNQARPNAVLISPIGLSDQARENLKSTWRAQYGGRDAHKTALLEDGIDFKELSINARDAMLLETRSFQRKQIANFFGIPSHLLGDSDKVAYNSLEQENLSYLTQALDHWLIAWEKECDDKLLTDTQHGAESHYFQFDRDALIRADITSRYSAWNMALSAGWMSKNEVRRKENMNPIPGPEGDEYGRASAMQAFEAPEDESDQADAGDDQEGRSQLLAVMVRMLLADAIERVTANIRQATRRQMPSNLEAEFGERFDLAVRLVLNIQQLNAGDPLDDLVGRARRRYFDELAGVLSNGASNRFALALAQEIVTDA